MVSSMADARQIAPAAQTPPDSDTGGVLLTQSDFDALVEELESLRAKHQRELAGRLREARGFGDPTENDDLLSALEESAVDRARIAQLEELVRLASIVDAPAEDGGAGLGSTVQVADDAGRTSEYNLIGRRGQASERNEVTMASPVGQALWGARPGDVVKVELPNGRERTLRVLEVRHGAEAAVRAA